MQIKQKFTNFIFVVTALYVLTIFSSCKPEKVKPQPTSDFSYSGSMQAPTTITFTNASTNASSYEWSFGDGTSSTEQSPVHAYSSGGTFVVSLKAKGEGGENSSSKTLVITSVIPAPIANFSILSGNNAYAPSSVYFLNSSTNASTYDWDFGDGTSHDSGWSPNHTYANGGIYTVTLKASNSNGAQNIITKTVNILTPPTQVRITKLQLNGMPFIGGVLNWDLLKKM